MAAHDGDAKSAARLRMPKPVPAHLQALEAAAQLRNAVATSARRESHELKGGVSMNANPATEDALQLLETQLSTQWQHDEHDRFMQALERFGREQSGDEWHNIAAFVRTRSADEVRHHGRCYLQHLVQEEYASSPSLVGFGDDREFSDNQNDPNRHNLVAGGGRLNAHWKSKGKSATARAVAALNCGPQSFQQQHHHQDHQQTPSDAPRKSGRKPKVWTFEEDKIFENALADWSGDKPYSWQKIATALPGKTAKDARGRYERLLGDVAMIETSGGEDDPSRHPHLHYAFHLASACTHAPHSNSLSDRIAPPPPIQVSDSTGGEGGEGREDTDTDRDDSLMLDSPGSATLRGAVDGSGSTLSPTFLEFLACEEKPPASSRDHSGGLTPLSPPSVLMPMPSPEHSQRSTPSSSYPSRSSGSRSTNSSSARDADGGGKSGEGGGREGGRARVTLRGGFATPRIWQEFLSDDFKFVAKSLPSSDELSGGAAETSDAASSTISQDLGTVNLLTPFGSSPPSSPPPEPSAASRRLRGANKAPSPRTESDEPMPDASMRDEELRPSESVQHGGGLRKFLTSEAEEGDTELVTKRADRRGSRRA